MVTYYSYKALQVGASEGTPKPTFTKIGIYLNFEVFNTCNIVHYKLKYYFHFQNDLCKITIHENIHYSTKTNNMVPQITHRSF